MEHKCENMAQVQVNFALKLNLEDSTTHRSELFDVLGTFLANCICFTVEEQTGFESTHTQKILITNKSQ